jgi:hypothetical protein
MYLSTTRSKALVIATVFSFTVGLITSCAMEHPMSKVPKEEREHPAETEKKEHPGY